MSGAAPAPLLHDLIPLGDSVSIARLHGQACLDCGTVAGRLHPAGVALHRGRRWPVVACDAHITLYAGGAHP